MFGIRKALGIGSADAMRDVLLGQDARTPDKFWLQTRANWLVFLYCDLQLDHIRAIDDCDLVGHGFTKQPHTVWKNDLGKLSHPIAFERLDKLRKVNHSRVRGQIVRMRSDRLIKLDEERQNKVQFLRKRIPIVVPYHMIKRDHKLQSGGDIPNFDYIVPCETTVWAWAYIGNPEFWFDEPITVSRIKTTKADLKIEYEYLISAHCRTKSLPSVKRYSPNNNAEPYYYFAPNDL